MRENSPVAIPQSFIQELLNRVDVVDVVGRYVQLKKGGANFMGLCPFHGEKSPSFSVSPTKQFYHCFGCGANGNAIGFLMEHAGMNFVEAVKDLAQQVGLQVPEDDVSPQERERAAQQRQKQVTLTDVLERAATAYQKQLKDSPRAVAYLKGRGLSGQIAKTFGLGYAPEGWRSLASVFPDYADPLLVESGMVIEHAEEKGPDGQTAEGKRYDRFRDRIMFPIRNVKGEHIGFGGRVLDKGEPKYLNSPEQGPRTLRPVRSPHRHPPARLRAGDRRLHGRGGLGPAGLCQRRGDAGHRLHARPCAQTVPLHRRGGVQL